MRHAVLFGMQDFTDNKPRKSRAPYRRHGKHKSANTLNPLDPEIQKALEELPAWMQRHAHRANLH
jgi:hypothetical protein